MEKISIEVYWDPLCLANLDDKGGVGCYKARLENNHECSATGKSRLEAMQNLLLKCADLKCGYVGIYGEVE